MFNAEPRSPALSASSSTGGSNFGEELPSTPGASDVEDFCELRLVAAPLRPHHIEICPLCITKTRSIVCADDENVDTIVDKKLGKEDEDEHDFYSRQFQEFISLYSPCFQVSAAPARPESVILSPEGASKLPGSNQSPVDAVDSQKLSHSAVPPVPVSVPMGSIRAKRVIPPMPTYSPPPPPVGRCPPPRMSVPSDIVEPDLFDEESVYSHPSSAPTHPLSPRRPWMKHTFLVQALIQILVAPPSTPTFPATVPHPLQRAHLFPHSLSLLPQSRNPTLA
ncbi:hypothetical protein K503DRAFT_805426 [Rhizopogon vinicolor AM-OR11-026]|uniref:Uncharacterized protein n=1 Tax=Rhizopogon vinicolor AM-OR11-026 TaxID=1314800 RepID=A0A1B7MHV5_9AGAM|nr:hypothetical protein K503DRAFT_805426 [Rhizopogon vinicolor AM-OR11-026]